jgi:hypothetical protein
VFVWPLHEAPQGGAGRHQRIAALDQGNRGSRDQKSDHEVADLSAAVARACAQVSWSAWHSSAVCREFSDDGSVQTFLAAFVVTDFPSEERLTTSRQLLASRPSLMQDGGIHVLTDVAVPNEVEPLGVQVYERSGLGRLV